MKKISLLISIMIMVSSVYADNMLSVQLEQSKKRVNDGSITVSITNITNENLEVLKWNTPFETTLKANVFTILQDGNTIPYSGMLVKRNHPSDSDYLLLAPGETKIATISLPKYYSITQRGNYEISYHGNFTYKNVTNTHTTSKTTSSSLNIVIESIELSSNSRKLPANFNGCSIDQEALINDAHDEALDLSLESKEAMHNAEPLTTAERYSTWFGSADTQRQTLVTDHFDAIYSALDTQDMTFDCSSCNMSAYAYVNPNMPYVIYLCDAFWSAPLTGTDSKAGTIIHETSHFTVVANTDDNAYGHSLAQSLAQTNPDAAVNNADSHEYFAENTPSLSMGGGDMLHFETAHPYTNNENQSGTLHIEGASCLTVNITGETESNYDFITVAGQRFDGDINEHFDIQASSVDYLFTSDSSITRNGVLVEINECTSTGGTTYETGEYTNNTDETQVLSIPGSLGLEVTITGEVEENYDKIFITDSAGNESVYTGVLDETFTVSGDNITVRFTSDSSITKSGVRVHIEQSNIIIPDENKTYESGAYTNNVDETKELFITGADGLTVTITGEIEENYDKLYITDSTGNETVYTGVLNETIAVSGDHITVRFTSDGSITKSGVRVHIEQSPSLEGITTYETGAYANNIDETQELSIAGANGLTVTITGEVEQRYDKIFITDSTGNVTEYTGVLNETFTVPGDHITVRFTSDGSITKSGAVVTITAN